MVAIGDETECSRAHGRSPVVDAIFGTGLSKEVGRRGTAVIGAVNRSGKRS